MTESGQLTAGGHSRGIIDKFSRSSAVNQRHRLHPRRDPVIYFTDNETVWLFA